MTPHKVAQFLAQLLNKSIPTTTSTQVLLCQKLHPHAQPKVAQQTSTAMTATRKSLQAPLLMHWDTQVVLQLAQTRQFATDVINLMATLQAMLLATGHPMAMTLTAEFVQMTHHTPKQLLAPAVQQPPQAKQFVMTVAKNTAPLQKSPQDRSLS